MRIRLCLPLLLALYTIPCAAQNVLTYHNDNARTGQNLNETVLNPGNVTMNTFGKLFILPTDGKVDAEPLYVGNLTVNSTKIGRASCRERGEMMGVDGVLQKMNG